VTENNPAISVEEHILEKERVEIARN